VHFIVASNGSFGDVHPFVAIAHALQARGHDVHLVSNPRYAELAGDLDFLPASTAEALARTIATFDVSRTMSFSNMKGLMRGLIVEPTRDFYRAISAVHRPGESVVFAFPFTVAARLAHDALGVPFVSGQLAPSAFRSLQEPVRPTASRLPSWTPDFVLKGALSMLDIAVDKAVLADLNPFRAELGLPPIRGAMRWADSPDKVLGLFPDWFGRPQADWPETVELTGFPHLTVRGGTLDEDLEAFLDSGPPPVLFTVGSPAQGVGDFFAHAAQACTRTGRRAILLTRFADDLPPNLPDTVHHVTFTDLGTLLPRCCCLVFHGGIGTAAQGLRAGLPLVVVPWGVDQFDNSHRLEQLGVAREVVFNRVTVDRLVEALDAVDQADVRSRSAALAARFPDDPNAATCDALESFGERALRARS